MKTITIRAEGESLKKLYQLLGENPEIQIVDSYEVGESAARYTSEITDLGIDLALKKEIETARIELSDGLGTGHEGFISELKSRYHSK
jgi:hypothetical protein